MHTTDQLNTSLAGRYAIDRLIGEGGMATVYLARDVKHNRRVALKVLKPDLGAIVGVDRFLSEIQVTANLQHPNLLPLFDSGAADGLLFYVMPYVEGESLRARIQREKQLPVEEAVRLATAIASALDYAHRHGVIHRDLKPENILLNEGQPLVADFGIALAVSNAGGNRITQTGLSLGTPQYMSPEQATGDRVIDARTDIYSLGAVTYEMLTGEPPHIGNTSQQVIARVLTERPRSIRTSRPTVPEQIEVTVERALEKLPADRWATAREFSEAMTGARIVTRSTAAAAATAMQRRISRREVVAWTVAAAAVTAVAILGARAERPVVPAVSVEFELEVPDSLDVIPRQSAAGLALSRDGTVLVFQATEVGNPQALYVRRLGERDVQRVRGSDGGRAPVLSPDGEDLLFIGGGGGGGGGAAQPSGLRRVSTRGGVARVLLDSVSGQPVSWREGQPILFAVGPNLFLGPPQGGARTLLARADTSRRHYGYAFGDVLPGGRAALITIRHVLTTAGQGLDSMALAIVTIPDGRVTELGIRGTMPRYSATGHLLYATADSRLYAAPFDPDELRLTGAAFPIVEDLRVGGGGAAGFAVADNGTLVYLTGGAATDDRQLVIVSRAGVERPLTARGGYYSVPRVSPDGRQIAVAAATAAGMGYPNPDIWRFDTTAKVLTRLTTDSNVVRPSWSPDGQWIAYGVRGGDTIVFARPLYAAQSTVAFRAPGRAIVDVAWGPAKGYSAFKIGVQTGTNHSDDIWLVHNDSLDKPRPLLAEPYEEQSPKISPDGRLLAYVSNRTGRNEVYIRPIPSGGEIQVTTDGAQEPVWSPDGKELFYRSARSFWSARLTLAPLAVASRDSLFRDVYPRNPEIANYDVFPDGEHFIVIGRSRDLAAARPQIVVRTNWHLRSSAAQPER